jgi:two-component system chemotaxis sensor kinase CheA
MVFQKMKRLIYDLSQKTTKKINAQISGEDTELDKNIVEKISDPLVHMVRNAVDHGIEEPGDRRRAGKPEEANVYLRAYQTSGSICIEIEDDGRGLNREKILKKAVDNGLLKERDPALLSDDEVFNLIFLPGFSTAEVVSDLSGRGVGMDVVRKNIDALRGNVKIDSRPGRGTRFSIYLPLTMAIMDGMVVMVGKERYIIPTMNVVEFFRPTGDNIVNVKGKDNMIKIHGDLMGFLKLKDFFLVSEAVSLPQDAMIVVVENIGKRMGLMVDSIIGQHQIVIKGLSEVLGSFSESELEFFLGASILPDGGVGLILDVQAFMKNYQ